MRKIIFYLFVVFTFMMVACDQQKASSNAGIGSDDSALLMITSDPKDKTVTSTAIPTSTSTAISTPKPTNTSTPTPTVEPLRIAVLRVNSSSEDLTINYKTVYGGDPLWFHFEVIGGDGKPFKIYTVETLPDGSVTDPYYAYVSRGYKGSIGWENGIYNNPQKGQCGYLTMDFYHENGTLLGSGKVYIGPKTSTELITPTPTPIGYYEGNYKVGTDIPAGDYVLFITSGSSAYFSIEKSRGEIIENDNFAYNSFIRIEEGQYLELDRCRAVPVTEKYTINTDGEGIFRVGIDIPAGEYKLLTTSTSTSGYYEVGNMPMSKDYHIKLNDNFKTSAYVTVYEGEYLTLVRCKLASQTPISTPKPTDTPKPTKTPKPTSTPRPTSTPKPTRTPTPTLIGYYEGNYKVGTDIPAGDYVLFITSGSSAYFSIEKSRGEIIENDNFAYNSFIRIEEGQYLELDRCRAVPVTEKYTINTDGEGIFRVGIDIPAGEYKLLTTSTSTSGYYEVGNMPMSKDYHIKLNDNFKTSAYVTVYEGEYLTLVRCKLASQTPISTPKPTDTLKPTKTPKPTSTPIYSKDITTLVSYISSYGAISTGEAGSYRKITETRTMSGYNITSTITYRDDIEKLIFHSKIVKGSVLATLNFDYDIASQTASSKLSLDYIDSGFMEIYHERADFNIANYTSTTFLAFETSELSLSKEPEGFDNICNLYAHIAIPAWGLLIADKTEMSLGDIGFYSY